MPTTLHLGDTGFSDIDRAANGAEIVTYQGVVWRRYDDGDSHFYIELPPTILDKSAVTHRILKTRYGPWRAWYGPPYPEE